MALPIPSAHYRLAGDTKGITTNGIVTGTWSGTAGYAQFSNGAYGAVCNATNIVNTGFTERFGNNTYYTVALRIKINSLASNRDVIRYIPNVADNIGSYRLIVRSDGGLMWYRWMAHNVSRYYQTAAGIIKAGVEHTIIIRFGVGGMHATAVDFWVDGEKYAAPTSFTSSGTGTDTSLVVNYADIANNLYLYPGVLLSDAQASELHTRLLSAYAPLPEPTAHYRLAGDRKNSLASDVLTQAGTESYQQFDNGAYGAFFDGGEYLESTAPLLSGRTFTIGMRVRFDAASVKTITCLVSQRSGTETGRYALYYYNTNRLSVTADGSFVSACVFTPVVGQDYTIVVACNNGTHSFYIDGVPVAKVTDTPLTNNISAVNTRFGRVMSDTTTDFYGTLGNAYIYNGVALSDAQAAELHKRLKRRISNNMINVASGATPPGDRANEVFATRNGAIDLSQHKKLIVPVNGLVIGNEWTRFTGASNQYFQVGGTSETLYRCENGFTAGQTVILDSIGTVQFLLNVYGAGGVGAASWGVNIRNNNVIQIATYNGVDAASTITDNTTPLAVGIPYRIVCVYEGGTTGNNGKIYLNGNLIFQGTLASIPQLSTLYKLTFGYIARLTSSPFFGLARDVFLRNEPMSADWVKMDWRRNRRTW